MAASTTPAPVQDGILDALLQSEAAVQLHVDTGAVTTPMAARRFSTGSAGFSWQGKVQGAEGRRYQVNVTAVLIGSKPAK